MKPTAPPERPWYRLRASTCVALLFVTGFFAWSNVMGQKAFAPLPLNSPNKAREAERADFRFGWPIPFFARGRSLFMGEGTGMVQQRAGLHEFLGARGEGGSFEPGALLGNLGILAVVLVVTGLTCELVLARSERRRASDAP
ncbi:MAG: hypothetical protein L6R28_13800 [Planctomycetes bacterium]|nr:hypothetical protein [Planctomycetota bacterium]